eukprot:6468114-Amphidinium_carterae.1
MECILAGQIAQTSHPRGTYCNERTSMWARSHPRSASNSVAVRRDTRIRPQCRQTCSAADLSSHTSLMPHSSKVKQTGSLGNSCSSRYQPLGGHVCLCVWHGGF